MTQSVTLDTGDPFEAAIAEIVLTARSKGADYALDKDPWSNFRGSATQFNLEIWEAAEFNVCQKLQRLRALRMNGRAPMNEASKDTYLDLAVYGVLAYAMFREEYEGKPIDGQER